MAMLASQVKKDQTVNLVQLVLQEGLVMQAQQVLLVLLVQSASSAHPGALVIREYKELPEERVLEVFLETVVSKD